MGIEKLGITFGKQFARCFQSCGKSCGKSSNALYRTPPRGLRYAPELKFKELAKKPESMVIEPKTTPPDMPYNNVRHLSESEKFAYYDKRYCIFKDNPNIKNSVFMHSQLSGMNCHIRTIDKHPHLASKEYSEMTDIIDSEFYYLSPLEYDVIGFRGRALGPGKQVNADFEIMEKAKVGDIVMPDTGYSYFAFENSLSGFTSSENRSIVYIVKFPKGSKVSRTSAHYDSGMCGELVTPRRARYKLLAKEVDKNGNMKVYMEYIVEELPKPAKINEKLKQEWLEDVYG